MFDDCSNIIDVGKRKTYEAEVRWEPGAELLEIPWKYHLNQNNNNGVPKEYAL